MAKTQIIGLIDICYNGMFVFRAFAEASIIVKYSKAVEAYQRIPEDKHVEDIKRFIIEGKSVYTPEVTLAYSIDDWQNEKINPDFCGGMIHAGSVSPIDFLTNGMLARDIIEMLPPRTVIALKDSMGIKFQKSRYSELITLTLPDNLAQKPFRRIDGNHRLEAFEQLKDKIAREIIPISILLLTNDIDKSDARQTEMTIFHNINAKAKSLTQIQQYRGFLNLFNVDELSKFGEEFAITKEFLDNHIRLPIENLSNYFIENDDMILKCVKFLLKKDCKITADKFAEVLSKLNNTYFAEYKNLQQCSNQSALIPYVYYYFNEEYPKVKLDAYTTWFLNNKLYNLKEFDPDSIIDVFEKIYEIRKKQIFVAMPFNNELEFVFQNIEEVVKKLNNDNKGLDLPLPVRIDKQIVGSSYDIVEEILTKIESAGLLIADLTSQNPNVYYEAGFAQGLIRTKLEDSLKVLYLISSSEKPQEPFDEVKFDLKQYKTIPYKNEGNGVNELKNAIEAELKAFYGIG